MRPASAKPAHLAIHAEAQNSGGSQTSPELRRRQVILDDIDHSSKSQVSRFTLHEETDEDGERTIELRNDNPFLHDNVD